MNSRDHIKSASAHKFRKKIFSVFAVATLLSSPLAILAGQGTPEEGKTHPAESGHANIQTLIDRANALSSKNDYAAAADIWRQLVIIAESAVGPNHLAVSTFLDRLGLTYLHQNQAQKAENAFQRALDIKERSLGPNHKDLSTSLMGLVTVHSNQHKLGEAEEYAIRYLAIAEKAFGSDALRVIIGLDMLAAIHGRKKQYSKAEDLYTRALLARQNSNANTLEVANNLFNIATNIYHQARLKEAEDFVSQALKIQEEVLGRDHVEVARALSLLMSIYIMQGNTEDIEPVATRIITIQKNAAKADSLDLLITTPLQLAYYFAKTKDYQKAKSYFSLALDTAKNIKTLDVYPKIAFKALLGLGWVYQLDGNTAKAEQLFDRARKLIKESPEPIDLLDAKLLHVYSSDLYLEIGRYDLAELLATVAVEIAETLYGSENFLMAIPLNTLANAHLSQQQYSRAHPILEKALKIQLGWAIRESPLIPDQARVAQMGILGNSWELPFGLTDLHPPFLQLALETRLNRNGLFQEIEQRQVLLLNAPGTDRAKVQQLQVLTQQLASVALPADRRAAVRQQRDILQAEIYRRQPDLEIQTVTITEVAKALPANGVLVEIQRYRPYDSRKSHRERWGEPQYIALVLKPNGEISAVPLGPAADIDATVHKVLSASAQNQPDAAALWAQLSDQLLKPLLPQLSGSRQWFLSPDGELNRVPFAALPAPQQPNQPLAAAVQLRVLTTGRDLVRLQHSTTRSQASLVMANPSFDRAGRGTALASANGSQPGGQARSADLGSTRWEPLPGTKREGQQVASLLGARLLSGPAATATALKQQQSPRVLHVATHGFFLADQNNPPTVPLRVVQEETAFLSALRQEGPLLRSGLVLAGANQPAADPNDDGHLTAAEILMINLRGTELVVLSACSTGQGEVRTGEGVYGLQRALTVAGARSTLLSLWKVHDAATAEFMARFYQRLKAGEGRAAALAAVQAAFRSGAVTSPTGDDWSEPYYWAAWQLTGDWGPIPGL